MIKSFVFQKQPITYCVLRSSLAKIRTTHYALRSSLAILLITLLLTACGNQTTTDPQPPTIHYGEDICEFCGMIISDERYAAGYVTQNDEVRIFDDVGGMFMTHLAREEPVTAFFVHDYEDTRWIRAETAHYVLSDDLPTPMLHGLVACDSQTKAEKLAAAYNGQVLNFEGVLAHLQENQTSMMPNSEHSHR